jgi:hypothetical protein
MLKLFTLQNGLEIIGKVTDSNSDQGYINVEQPLVICTQPTGPDTYGLIFRPYGVANPEGTHKFYTSGFSSEANIPNEIEKAYIKYTSKIQLL